MPLSHSIIIRRKENLRVFFCIEDFIQASDKYNMGRFHYLFNLCLSVLKDWRVIVVTVFLIFYIALVNYVVNYQKKKHVYKAKKSAAVEKKASGGEGNAGASNAGGAAEGS